MKVSKKNIINKRKLARENEHLTRPPRMEGVVRNAQMLSPRQPKEKKQ